MRKNSEENMKVHEREHVIIKWSNVGQAAAAGAGAPGCARLRASCGGGHTFNQVMGFFHLMGACLIFRQLLHSMGEGVSIFRNIEW